MRPRWRMLLSLLLAAISVPWSSSAQEVSLTNESIRVDVRVTGSGIWLTRIEDVPSGQIWLRNPAELFEFSDGSSVWRSNGDLVIDSVRSTPPSHLAIGGHTPDSKLQFALDIVVPAASNTATVSGWVSNTLQDWVGPSFLGDPRQSPAFPTDAELAAVRRTPRHGQKRRTPPHLNKEVQDLNEEVLIVGSNGLIYHSEKVNDGPWSKPQPLQSDSSPFKDLFPPGAPISAVRRNDHQADAFAISQSGDLFTVFRVDDNAWSDPVQLSHSSHGSFQPNGSVVALSAHEEADPRDGSGPRINELMVFGVSTQGRVYVSSEINDGAFSEPAVLPQPHAEAVGTGVHLATIKRNQQQQDLFTVDSHGALRRAFHVRGASQWSDWTTLSTSDRIVSNARLAAVQGSGQDEYVFVVGRGPGAFSTRGSIYESHVTNGDRWTDLAPILPSPVQKLEPGSSIAAVRRSGGEIDVFVVLSDGSTGFVTRSPSGRWGPFALLPAAHRVTGNGKIVASLRSHQQLDLFGVSQDSGLLWTAVDGQGSFLLRTVFPKIKFADSDTLAGSFAMIPQEMGSLVHLRMSAPQAPPCPPPPPTPSSLPAPIPDIYHQIGMPYGNDQIAQDIGLPEAMNTLEVANIARNGRSLFFADLGGNVEAGRAPIQFTVGPDELDGFWVSPIKGQQQVSLPPFAIGVADGDFRRSIDFYLPWHASELHAPDTPSWLREAGAIYAPTAGGYGGIFLNLPGSGGSLPDYASKLCTSGAPSFRCVLRRMRSEAEALGTDVLYLADYWEGSPQDCQDAPANAPYFCKGDYFIRKDLGGLSELRAAIDELHELQCAQTTGGPAHSQCRSAKIILYLEPFLIFPSSAVGASYGEMWGSRSEFLPSGTDVWEPFERDRSLAMAQGNREWQQYLVGRARDLIAETHADGIFLDSGGWRLNIPSWTRQEVVFDSSLENAMAVLDLADRVRAAIRSVNPNAVVLAETTSGPMWRHVDGGVSADLNCSGGPFTGAETIAHQLLTSPTRYALPQMNFFSNGLTPNQMNQVFATGHSLALSTNWDPQNAPSWIHNNAPYIRALVQARQNLVSALVYGRQISQLDVTGSQGGAAVIYTYSGSPSVVVVLNPSEQGTPFLGTIPQQGLMSLSSRWRDALTGEEFVVGVSGLTLSVPPPPLGTGTCSNMSSCGLRILVQQPLPRPHAALPDRRPTRSQ